MDILLIVMLIIFTIVAVIIFKFVGKLIKAFFMILSLAALLSFVFGIFLYLDVNDLKENFGTSEKLLVLENNGQVVSAFLIINFTGGENPKIISDSELASYNKYYIADDYESILGDKYMMFLFQEEFFDGVNEIKIGSDSIPITKIKEILASSSAKDTMIDLLLEQKGMPKDNADLRNQIGESIESDAYVKGLLFAGLFQAKLSGENPAFILEEIKEDNLILYPEKLIFKIFKSVPSGIVNKIVDIGDKDGNVGQT